MALVLDGNGTMTVGNGAISGLTTSGFPSSFITSSHIVDGTIVQGDLSSTLGFIGVGQTLTNYSSSGRAMGTTYTNSTGKPIAVMFAPGASGNLFCAALIDGNVVEYTQFTPSGGGGTSSFFIMVPNGSTYQMRNDGNAGISYWWEWR
jgi:hypothetical protein